MSQRLVLTDSHAAADALTFAGRSAPIGDGGVRLQGSGGVLVMTSAPLAPRGLLDTTPTVLGMRVLSVDPELVCDIVVEASALAIDPAQPEAILLPETGLSPAWAGVTPPRSGWKERPAIAASTLAARAQWGIATVAEGLPADAGEEVVRALRASVWGAPDEQLDALPLGVAFAAFALGFIGGDERAVVRTTGPWTRISLQRGHVVVRGPRAMGLTPVRRTGRGDD
jgi:hypothetical protein